MKYYSEEETKELRQALEEQVLNWTGVTKKKMFGCPCYKANEKLFAFLVTNGIVITKLQPSDREEQVNTEPATSKPGKKQLRIGWNLQSRT